MRSNTSPASAPARRAAAAALALLLVSLVAGAAEPQRSSAPAAKPGTASPARASAPTPAMRPADKTAPTAGVLPADARVPAARERVAVLDAGSFVVLEVHQAPLGEVLDRLRARLDLTFHDTDRLDLSRVIEGRTRGTVLDVLRWLVPEGGFLLTSEELKPGDTRQARVRNVYLVRVADERGQRTGTAAAPDPAAGWQAAAPANDAGLAGAGASNAAVAAAAATAAAASPDAAGKPKPAVPHTPASEVKTVAEQLRAATPLAQLQREQEAREDNPSGVPPVFLRPGSDAAQTTLRQQMERSQALAVEQLGMLREAYRAACTSGTPNAPC